MEVSVGGEDAGGEGVERADPRLVVRRGVQRVDAALQVVGGVGGEGQQEDLTRPQPVLLEEAEVHGDDSCRLARAGPGDDPERALIHVRQGTLLVRVEGEAGRGQSSLTACADHATSSAGFALVTGIPQPQRRARGR